MRQFEVYENPSARSRAIIPFIVVLQSHLLGDLPSVVVAPMLIDDGRSAYTEASVVVEFGGASYIVSVLELATVDTPRLRHAVGDLRSREDDLRRALDRIFTGF